jgi:single-stranded DNA-binding protein
MAVMKQITAYVERDRQVPPSSTASVTRSQLSVGAIQASLATDQLHNQGKLIDEELDDRTRTEWHRVYARRNLSKFTKTLQKGQLITLEGIVRYRDVEDEVEGTTFKHRIAYSIQLSRYVESSSSRRKQWRSYVSSFRTQNASRRVWIVGDGMGQ